MDYDYWQSHSNLTYMASTAFAAMCLEAGQGCFEYFKRKAQNCKHDKRGVNNMAARIGFDNEKYLQEQTAAILERANQFNNKLYLEFGGKLLFDHHAARVLPRFDPNIKMRLLQKIRDRIDVILCIYAGDIERKKVRADFGITYDSDALKTIDDFKEWGINVTAVVITRYANQPSARAFKSKLERRGIWHCCYTHPE